MNERHSKQIKNICVIVNPRSGKGKSLALARSFQKLAETNGLHTHFLTPTSPQEATEDLHNTLPLSDMVVVAGGDGSVHLSIQEVARSYKPLFVIPTGTGNDFAQTNNTLEINLPSAIDRIKNIEPKFIDVGSVSSSLTTEYFGQVLSTGFDSLVNRRANRMKIIRGRIKYTIATLLELPKFKAIDYRIKIDDNEIHVKAMLVSVANGPTYGGGMKIVPHANRADGYLDVMILREVSKLELLRVFPKVFTGAHKNHPAVSFYRCKRFELDAQALAYADGEYIGELPIKGEIVPHALSTWEEL